MPRRPRVFIEGGVYHLYNRCARGVEVFQEDEEAERFVELLRLARDRDGLSALAWCLMPSHYHFAVRVGPVPLARTMGFVQARFGQGYNLRLGSWGPLWQSRYRAKVVEETGYLDQLVAYIHLNPVAAGLVDDPADYAWSGHRELVRRVKEPLIDVDTVLAGFGATVRAARRAYGRALAAGRESGWLTERPGSLPWWGPEPDRAVEPPVGVDELGRGSGRERRRVDLDTLLRLACARLGIDRERLAGWGQGREVSRARYLVAALGVERWGLRCKAIGDALGRRGDVVSRWVRQGVELRRRDPGFAAMAEEVDQALREATAVSPR